MEGEGFPQINKTINKKNPAEGSMLKAKKANKLISR